MIKNDYEEKKKKKKKLSNKDLIKFPQYSPYTHYAFQSQTFVDYDLC